MVGIVVVAHSAVLAESVAALAQQMLRGAVSIAAAGGIDDPEHPFGTDPFRIVAAIESVYSDDGVVVLMDIGSSLLSAQSAVELLSGDRRSGVRLCEAPLVEGTIAAAVQAASGAGIEQVMLEAAGALAAKREQLFGTGQELALEIKPPPKDPGATARARIVNDLGIHARPAALLVAAASRFRSDITLQNSTRGTPPVNAKSINSVTALGALKEHEIVISASGEDADGAVDALKALMEEGFEEAYSAAPESARGEKTGVPVCVAPGIAVGPAVVYRPGAENAARYRVEDPGVQWERLTGAIDRAGDQLRTRRKNVEARAGEYDARILDAHLLSLQDPELLETARKRIFDERINAEAAWSEACEEMLGRYTGLQDAYLRSRSEDLVDVKNLVLGLLTGPARTPFHLEAASILIARELNVSDALALDTDLLLGVCTAFGAPMSHTAVLLRSLGIPALFGMGTDVLETPEGMTVVLDAENLLLLVNPPDPEAHRERQRLWQRKRLDLRVESSRPAFTSDDRRVELQANVNSAREAAAAAALGADGIGVFRTEYLFLRRASAPSEEEQADAYSSAARWLGQRPLTIRTLDIGGDKPASYLKPAQEHNPLLGVRGIRLCFLHPDTFRTQLRAILRASADHDIRILFPMIATIEEIRRAKKLLEDAKRELASLKIPHNRSPELGLMIEVPSAVLLAREFSKEVDFFSIGTNDLTQYIMAADRTNPSVTDLNDALHPAVLRSIARVVDAGHGAGIRVGVCGEIAGDTLATPLLVGLEVDELSMTPPMIPDVKQAVARTSMKDARALASEALGLSSAAEVKKAVRAHFPTPDDR